MSMKAEIDLRPSDIAGKWWHNKYCTDCRAQIGHEEMMTQICLSCGSKFAKDILRVRSRASREFFDGEKWVIQHRYEDGSFGYSPRPASKKATVSIPSPAPSFDFGVASVAVVLLVLLLLGMVLA